MNLIKNTALILVLILSPLTCFGASATMAVTPAGAGDKSGTAGDGVTLDWDNAMGYAEWETDAEAFQEAGDIYYVAGGTYTLTSNFTFTANGATSAPVKVIGVKSGTTAESPTYSDYAFGDDRPLIAAGSYYFWPNKDYMHTYNIRLTGTGATYLIMVESYGFLVNCKSNNTGNGDGMTFYTDRSYIIKCETQATNDDGIDSVSGYRNHVLYSYIHDCGSNGIEDLNYYSLAIGNVIDTITASGITLTSVLHNVINNTIYNCGTGISGGTSHTGVYINNIIDACTTGASWTSSTPIDYWDYNVWDNTSDTTNVTKGPNAITGDPGMGSAGSGDFTVGSGSNVLDAGMQIGTTEGVTGNYKWNVGVDQDDVTAAGGGGGGRRSGWSIQ